MIEGMRSVFTIVLWIFILANCASLALFSFYRDRSFLWAAIIFVCVVMICLLIENFLLTGIAAQKFKIMTREIRERGIKRWLKKQRRLSLKRRKKAYLHSGKGGIFALLLIIIVILTFLQLILSEFI